MKKSIAAIAGAAVISMSAAAQQAPAPQKPDPVPAPPFNVMYGDVAKVLSAKPVSEAAALPKGECRLDGSSSSVAPELPRCDAQPPSPGSGERIVAYDVTYEYNGRQFNVRMPYDPGEQMPVNVHVVPPTPRPPMNRPQPGGSGPQNPRYRGA